MTMIMTFKMSYLNSQRTKSVEEFGMIDKLYRQITEWLQGDQEATTIMFDCSLGLVGGWWLTRWFIIAIETGLFLFDLPTVRMVMFHRFLYVYQAGYDDFVFSQWQIHYGRGLYVQVDRQSRMWRLEVSAGMGWSSQMFSYPLDIQK